MLQYVTCPHPPPLHTPPGTVMDSASVEGGAGKRDEYVRLWQLVSASTVGKGCVKPLSRDAAVDQQRHANCSPPEEYRLGRTGCYSAEFHVVQEVHYAVMHDTHQEHVLDDLNGCAKSRLIAHWRKPGTGTPACRTATT